MEYLPTLIVHLICSLFGFTIVLIKVRFYEQCCNICHIVVTSLKVTDTLRRKYDKTGVPIDNEDEVATHARTGQWGTIRIK